MDFSTCSLPPFKTLSTITYQHIPSTHIPLPKTTITKTPPKDNMPVKEWKETTSVHISKKNNTSEENLDLPHTRRCGGCLSMVTRYKMRGPFFLSSLLFFSQWSRRCPSLRKIDPFPFSRPGDRQTPTTPKDRRRRASKHAQTTNINTKENKNATRIQEHQKEEKTFAFTYQQTDTGCSGPPPTSPLSKKKRAVEFVITYSKKKLLYRTAGRFSIAQPPTKTGRLSHHQQLRSSLCFLFCRTPNRICTITLSSQRHVIIRVP